MNNNTNAVKSLVLSSMLTLSIIAIAFFLSSMSRSVMIPVTAIINAEYQMESAIIMQTQKLRENPSEKSFSMEKLIMPGLILKLDTQPLNDRTWLIKASVKGHGIHSLIEATVQKDKPEQINFTM